MHLISDGNLSICRRFFSWFSFLFFLHNTSFLLLLLLQFGQDGWLAFREWWHFFKDSGLWEEMKINHSTVMNFWSFYVNRSNKSIIIIIIIIIINGICQDTIHHHNKQLTKTSGDATVLSFKYSRALCWISASEFLRLESLRKILNGWSETKIRN